MEKRGMAFSQRETFAGLILVDGECIFKKTDMMGERVK